MNDDFGQNMARGLDTAFNGHAKGGARKTGFALFWFEFGATEGSRVNYVSNAKRADMIVAMKEWLARAEGRTQESPVGIIQ